MKFKVLHILGELKYSGAEVMLKGAHKKFEELKIETHILSTGKLVGEFDQELTNCNYIIEHIPFSKSIKFVQEVFKLIKKEKFDVIHIHTERFFFFYILIAKFAGSTKIIRTIHSTFIFKGWLRYRRRTMLKYGKFLGCKYVAISKNVQENELEQNNLSCILINNWIDTDYFKPNEIFQDYLFKSEILNLISVGSCTGVKQHFHIINIVSKLKYLSEKVFYTHIGSGDLENHEIKLSNDLNIDDSIVFLGNQSDVLPFLLKSEFFLMPSQYEGLGNSCLEAMSSGLIPIVNNVPGLKDLVLNDFDGLVVNFNDETNVAQKIIELSRNEKLKSKLKFNARQKILNNYSLSNINKLTDLYFLK